MTVKAFCAALRSCRRVFVQVGCTGSAINVARGFADDVQSFQISKAEARRVLVREQGSDIIAMIDGDLYIN